MPEDRRPPEPWDSFLKALDAVAQGVVRLDCLGGFVVSQLYGFERTTADLDVMELAPFEQAEKLMSLGAEGSPLHQEHHVFIHKVGVATVPEDYEARLLEMFPGAYMNLRLMALDPYDLALSKLERNSQKDRDDVRFLAKRVPFDLDLLQQRYRTELRWQLGVAKREDLTLELWVEMIEEDRLG
jgi:hypothetical protein